MMMTWNQTRACLSFLALMALCSCKRSGDEDPIVQEFWNFDYTVVDAGDGSFDLVVSAENVGIEGSPPVAGLSFELKTKEGEITYVPKESRLGKFFQGGRLGGGHSQEDDQRFYVGAAIKSNGTPDTSGAKAEVMRLRFRSSSPKITSVVKNFRLFQREPQGGYAIELDAGHYSYRRLIEAPL